MSVTSYTTIKELGGRIIGRCGKYATQVAYKRGLYIYVWYWR
jgi:hypothetical protein